MYFVKPGDVCRTIALLAVLAGCSPGAQPTGCLSGDCTNGEGRFVSVLRKEGRGSMSYTYVNDYKGQWKDGLRSGKGAETIFLRSGHKGKETDEVQPLELSRYEGAWLDDRKHGYGYEIKRFENGNRELYEGYWKNGFRHGEGVEVCYDASWGKVRREYAGDWSNGRKHGYGVEQVLNPKASAGDSVLESRFSGVWRDGEAMSKPEDYSVCGAEPDALPNDRSETSTQQTRTRL